jgi:hypothetical protein
MRNLTATICLTLAVLLGSAGVSWGAEKQPFWALSKVLADHPDPSLKDDEFVKRAKINFSFSGLRGNFFAAGWVNLRFGECGGAMVVNGDLTVYQEGSKVGALLRVVNLPLGKTIYEEESDNLVVLQLNQKTAFTGDEKLPIRWIDIDGDGVEELIYSSVCGNRSATHHFIYEYDTSPDRAKFSNPIEVRNFNPDDFPQTIIKTNWSSSSCGIRWETYESMRGKYVLTEVSVTDDETGKCVTETFNRRDDGQMCLAERSISKWVNKTNEWVRKKVSKHSNETCHPLPK